MNTNLLELHREYLIDLIKKFMNTLDNKCIEFSCDGWLVEQTYVKSLMLQNGELFINVRSEDEAKEITHTEHLDYEEYDDLFLTELLGGIENDGANKYRWRIICDGEDTFKSVARYDTMADAYNAMKMAAYREIDDLVKKYDNAINVRFHGNNIIITYGKDKKIFYSVLRLLS